MRVKIDSWATFDLNELCAANDNIYICFKDIDIDFRFAMRIFVVIYDHRRLNTYFRRITTSRFAGFSSRRSEIDGQDMGRVVMHPSNHHSRRHAVLPTIGTISRLHARKGALRKQSMRRDTI